MGWIDGHRLWFRLEPGEACWFFCSEVPAFTASVADLMPGGGAWACILKHNHRRFGSGHTPVPGVACFLFAWDDMLQVALSPASPFLQLGIPLERFRALLRHT